LLEERCLLSYTITDLGSFGGPYSDGYGINNKGEATGRSGVFPIQHAFLYSNGSMKDLGALGTGTQSIGYDLNDSGQVSGHSTFRHDANARFRGFLYSDGLMTDLGTLGGVQSYAEDTNNRGVIAGFSDLTTDPPYAYHGFVYDGTMTDLRIEVAETINDVGSIAGMRRVNAGYHLVVYQHGAITDLGPLFGYGFHLGDMNDNGEIVGTAQVAANSSSHAFVYRNDVFVDLGPFKGTTSVAEGINEAGDVVGYSETPGKGDFRPFLYRNGQMTDLNDLIPADSGWEVLFARGINDHGQIVGTARNRKGYDRAVILTPVRSSPQIGTALRPALETTPSPATEFSRHQPRAPHIAGTFSVAQADHNTEIATNTRAFFVRSCVEACETAMADPLDLQHQLGFTMVC
jgi:probable HAF family extracellular repeat protein